MVFYKNRLIWFERRFEKKGYERTEKVLTENLKDPKGYFHTDILELKSNIRNSADWNKDPEEYGTDRCFDGSHTIYSVIYPDNRIKSMYMRCWMSKEQRNRRN